MTHIKPSGTGCWLWEGGGRREGKGFKKIKGGKGTGKERERKGGKEGGKEFFYTVTFHHNF